MKNYNLLKKIMKELNISTWLMYSEEHSDSIFEKYICDDTIVPACAIITTEKIHLIVNTLDYDNIDQSECIVHTYGVNQRTIKEAIYSVLKECNFPDNIALSYTTHNDALVDKLGYGTYQYLIPDIQDYYEKNNKVLNISSAENIIYALFDKKTNKTVDRMKIAADRAIDILEETFRRMKENMTELEIVALVHDIFNEKTVNEKIEGVISEDYSWKKDICPIVLVGPSLEKGGHAMASNQKLQKGHTIYFDFGVSLTFEDGEKVCSDLQRMGHLLKENEETAPPEVERVFRTLIKSIDIGIEGIKPNMKGYEVDKVVRDYILENGYPDYNHSTGHAIGEEAHSPGTLLGLKENKLSNLIVQETGVYTIEPRIAIPNGGSIEEMVYVSKDGGIPVSRRQKELYLLK